MAIGLHALASRPNCHLLSPLDSCLQLDTTALRKELFMGVSEAGLRVEGPEQAARP
jgi:hypothetical protein